MIRGPCGRCGREGQDARPRRMEWSWTGCYGITIRCERCQRADIAKRLPDAHLAGARPRRLAPLIVVAAFAVAALLTSCCKTPAPKPPAPPIVTTDRSCLEGIEPPEERLIPRVACSGHEFLCLTRMGAAVLGNVLADLYRYRDQVEQRCRPKPETTEETSP